MSYKRGNDLDMSRWDGHEWYTDSEELGNYDHDEVMRENVERAVAANAKLDYSEIRWLLVNAGFDAHEYRPVHKKKCPRCGQELLQDMDVCYGCLYDFTR